MLKKYFLLTTIVLGFIILIPTFHFHELLSQGDHGRDLYAAQAVLRGEIPYKNFWWVYGPLMPYYYAPFYEFLGQNIPSILMGKAVLRLLACLFFFLAASRLMGPFASMIAALWFLLSMPDFFFTFNHLGGIVMINAFMWCAISYMQTKSITWIWRSFLFIGILGLIKINFALTSLLVCLLLYIGMKLFDPNTRRDLLNQQTRIVVAITVFGLPLLWFIVYMFFLNGLTIHEIRQCLPYLGGDQPHNYPMSVTIPYYFMQHWLTITHHFEYMTNAWRSVMAQPQALSTFVPWLILISSTLNFLLHPIWHSMTIGAFYFFGIRKNPDRRLFWRIIIFLFGYFVLNFHEYVVSIVWYRTFWCQPMLLFFHACMIAFMLKILPRFAQIILAVIFTVLIGISAFVSWGTINSMKVERQYLKSVHAAVHISNEPAWVDTVNHVTAYLKTTLKDNETFFALPYDDIYYYLTNKPSPTRQLIFFDHIKIPQEQELRIIQELEKNHTQYVLVSNRIKSPEIGLGEWGRTYCPEIFKYVMANFTPVFRYGGNWEADPGWANNHGVIIFKKK